VVQAELLYSDAAETGDVDALLEFAQFMRRVGRLERAAQLNREALRVTSTSTSPDVVARRVSALANLGVIRRKQGALRDSRAHLQEAVSTARTLAAGATAELEYALDNLGLTCLQQGEREAGVAAMMESLASRQVRGDTIGEAKSLVNVARVDLDGGDHDRAFSHLDRAVQLLADGDDPVSLANAHVARGELHLAAGRAAEASEEFDHALELNRTVANSDGIGIACALRAQAALATGDIEGAKRYCALAGEEASASGNRLGEFIVRRVRAAIALAEHDQEGAATELDRALELAPALGQARITEVVNAIAGLGRG
jgi:tetratricopeptide (TPR) repeat protein